MIRNLTHRGKRRRRTSLWGVKFHAYNGMTIPVASCLEKNEAVYEVRHRNRAARRRGQPVCKLDGNAWEHGEEEGNGMVGDRHGILVAFPETE